MVKELQKQARNWGCKIVIYVNAESKWGSLEELYLVFLFGGRDISPSDQAEAYGNAIHRHNCANSAL